MQKRIGLLVCFLLGLGQFVSAQYDALFSQYFMTMPYYNPASIGESDDLNLLALHRQQWLGIKNAPKTFLVMADMGLKFGKTRHGVGVTMTTESIGLFQNTHIGVQYAYKQPLLGGVLSLGVQASLINSSFDGTKLELVSSDYHQTSDPAIPTTQVESMGFDANIGAYYSHKYFYAGFAMMHVTQPELRLQENIYTYIGRSLNFTAGSNIQLKNPLFEIRPSVFFRADGNIMQGDVTGRVVYNKMFNGGVSWRVNESVILLLGASFKRFDVGYAYDFPTTAIIKGSSGSHEIYLRYRLKIKRSKSGKYKHKSVRIL